MVHCVHADAIMKEIEDETKRYLQQNGKVVSADPIQLTVHSPLVPNLTLVDMPGLHVCPTLMCIQHALASCQSHMFACSAGSAMHSQAAINEMSNVFCLHAIFSMPRNQHVTCWQRSQHSCHAGLTKVPIDGQPKSIVKDLEDMARTYIKVNAHSALTSRCRRLFCPSSLPVSKRLALARYSSCIMSAIT